MATGSFLTAAMVEHFRYVARERGMHVADEPVLCLLHRERHPVWPLQRVAELAVASLVPRHVMTEDFEKPLDVPRLIKDDVKGQLLFEFVQLFRLQFNPHVRVAIIRPGHRSVN